MEWGGVLLLCGVASAQCWNQSLHDLALINQDLPKRNGELKPDLILKGPINQIGDFRDCVYKYEEQYCMTEVELSPINHNTLFWQRIQKQNKVQTNYRRDLLYVGVCVPSGCEHEEITQDLQDYLSPAANSLGVSVNVTVRDGHCQTKAFKPLSTLDYVAGLIIMGILTLGFCGTIYDSFRRLKDKKKPPKTKRGKLLNCFSILCNWERLGTLSDTEDSKSFRCIQGIRAISMYLVVAGHVLFASMYKPLKNPEFIEESYHDFFRVSLCNGQATMSTFFCISGLLLSYFFLKEADARGSITMVHVLKAILHRYMRLTPVYAIVILLQATWFDRMGTGPIWPTMVSAESENCRLYGWTNLLYLNNYVHWLNPCLIHTWYLAADFQCYVLSMLILVPVWKYPRHARHILCAVLAVWIAVPFVQTYLQQLDPVLLNTPENVKHFPADKTFHSRYISFHGNAGAYTVGVIFGYFYYHAKNKPIKRTKRIFFLVWTINLTVPWTILVLPFIFYLPGYTYNVLAASIYACISKVIYAAGIGTIVTSFALGYGGIGNAITSWKPFQIFGRLSYSVYLIHPCLLRMEAGATKDLVFLTEYTLFQEWFASIVISSIVALLLCLLVELPSSALPKLFSRPGHNQEEMKPMNKYPIQDGTTKEALLDEQV